MLTVGGRWRAAIERPNGEPREYAQLTETEAGVFGVRDDRSDRVREKPRVCKLQDAPVRLVFRGEESAHFERAGLTGSSVGGAGVSGYPVTPSRKRA